MTKETRGILLLLLLLGFVCLFVFVVLNILTSDFLLHG